jgi:hydrogenase-4 component F
VRGALRVTPVSASLWIAGFLAIAGFPPFGPFLSELSILRGALAAGRLAVAASYLALLGLVFIPMAGLALPMALGSAPPDARRGREPWSALLPPLLLSAAVLGLGLWIPAPLARILDRAAALLGAAP